MIKASLKARGYHLRAPRVRVSYPARLLESDGCSIDIVITEVSSAGFALRSDAMLELGDEVSLTVPKLPPMRAVIRWTCGNEAGGTFLDPISL